MLLSARKGDLYSEKEVEKSKKKPKDLTRLSAFLIHGEPVVYKVGHIVAVQCVWMSYHTKLISGVHIYYRWGKNKL